MKASKSWNDGVKSGVYAILHEELGGYLPTAQVAPGVYIVGTSLIRALGWNVGTLHGMLRENPISVDHEGGKYRCPGKGADHPAVARKFL